MTNMTDASNRLSLGALAGRIFDVVIIGGGVNGASVANHLSAGGYSVLLVEKTDFGSGASSRSSRLLHCGLAGLAPPQGSPWKFLLRPDRLKAGLKSAREMAKARQEFVLTMPEWLPHFTFCYPLHDDDLYSGRQVDLAFKLLEKVGGSRVPLDYKRLSRSETLSHPVGRYLATDGLRGMATFTEYQYDFAERMVVDTLLAAQQNGALSRNYTAATKFQRNGDVWDVTLEDQLSEPAHQATVKGRLMLNLTGAWIDQVNTLNPEPANRRFIQGHKGVHIMVRLPNLLRNFGTFRFTKAEEALLYVIPWRGLHYVGPTDLPYDGSLDDVRPTEQDLEVVLRNFATVLPSIPLSRKDILYAWAGIQPRTFEPHDPHGSWSREFRRVGPATGPQMFALTGATLGRSRMSGRDGLELVKSVISPSGTRGRLNYGAHRRPDASEVPQQRDSDNRIDLADIAYAVEQEQACTIEDVMFRRLGIGWDWDMGRADMGMVAQEMGRLLDWSSDRVEAEKQAYLKLITERYWAAQTDRHEPPRPDTEPK
ncbi:FAD-dependent oxidoreductase [Pseudomonas fluorescens]|uniref:FAD-dependent oxidoreductase n=1 Tax=Pseudomonas fluorescens TaxID=294 RepID=UPI00123FC1E5|nr:FAD-dependent oxidoreductase [Pseudomonas fluorescens]